MLFPKYDISFYSFFIFLFFYHSILPSESPSCSSLDCEEPDFSPDQGMDTSGSSNDDPFKQSQAPKPKPDPGKVPKWLKLPGEDNKL